MLTRCHDERREATIGGDVRSLERWIEEFFLPRLLATATQISHALSPR